MKAYKKYIKRALDFILAAAALTAFSPIILAASALVKINLGSPVIFKQRRPGRNGELFTLYKFKTMTDKRGAEGELLPDEIRLTRFGRALRSTSLDELPELVNIVKGEMSIVGPRPLLAEYLPLYSAEQNRRHEVRPGLTGLAQVNGRNATTWKERFRFDVEYVDNVSFLLDVKIICRTVGVVLGRRGVSAAGHATMESFAAEKAREDGKKERI